MHVLEIASKILRQASKDSGGVLQYRANWRAVDMNNISRRNFALLELSQCIMPSVGFLHYVVAVHCQVRSSERWTLRSLNVAIETCSISDPPTAIEVKKVNSHGLAFTGV